MVNIATGSLGLGGGRCASGRGEQSQLCGFRNLRYSKQIFYYQQASRKYCEHCGVTEVNSEKEKDSNYSSFLESYP